MNDPKLLTSAEVAEKFGVSAKSVARWAKEGKLKAAFRTLGGHRRYRESDVEALLVGERFQVRYPGVSGQAPAVYGTYTNRQAAGVGLARALADGCDGPWLVQRDPDTDLWELVTDASL